MDPAILVFLGLLAAYVTFVFFVVRTGRLEKWGLSLMLGIVLMVRTQRGKRLIDAIARPRRLWNVVGDAGIGLTIFLMLAMTVFFLWSVYFALQPDSRVPALGPTEIFVIPGVTPFVPLWYGLVGLIVTLVVHEGGHGVLARANKMKLKSIGLLWFIVPIGAFVEPDDLDLKVASRRQRLRVFGAGPAVNFAFATLAIVGFAAMMGSAAPSEGVHVRAISDDPEAPAVKAGIQVGDTITSVDGQRMVDWSMMLDFLDGAPLQRNVSFGLADGRTVDVRLIPYWRQLTPEMQDSVQQFDETGQALCSQRFNVTDKEACIDKLQQTGFLGIGPFVPSEYSFLADPLTGRGFGLLNLFALPLSELQGSAPVLSLYLPAFYETPFEPALFWPLANILFWIFWINLAVGITNVLPMLPLDGGHIFRDAVGGLVQAVRPRMPAERRDRLVGLTAGAMSLIILGAFLLQILGPHLRNLLAS